MSRTRFSFLSPGDDSAPDEAAAEAPAPRERGHRSTPAREVLIEQIAKEAESTVLTLDPALIDDSPYRDRIGLDDASVDGLMASIAGEGQRIPILVRRNPANPKRYQVAYGHRRLRAIRRLNGARAFGDDGHVAVRAFVQPLSDEELARAQGIENAERLDLSWIERARFLRNLEDTGFALAVAIGIVRVNETQASRMRTVLQKVPAAVVDAIGPAQGIGEPRWTTFADLFAADGAEAERRCATLLGSPGFLGLDAAGRFMALFTALRERGAKNEATPSSMPVVSRRKAKVAVVAPAEHEAFAAWLEARMGGLWRTYLESLEQPPADGRGSGPTDEKE